MLNAGLVQLMRGVRRHGARQAARIIWEHQVRPRLGGPLSWHRKRFTGPSLSEVEEIEAALTALGEVVTPLRVTPDALDAFGRAWAFPESYHGGPGGAAWREKLLEHHLAWRLGRLDALEPHERYVDIAGASSPWASLLHAAGLNAVYLDRAVQGAFRGAPYALEADATATPFGDGSVTAASLQCAFELFEGDADTRLVRELARILRPGGRAVISPLYMHVTARGYRSPDQWGRSGADPEAMLMVDPQAYGVRFARHYSALSLVRRVLQPARALGLRTVIHRLTHLEALGPGLYCHFALVLEKP